MEVQSLRKGAAEAALDSRDELLEALYLENAQLQHALSSRIVIEQAKGAVSARCEIPVDVAFEMIRGMARSQQRKLPEFCAEIVANGGRFADPPTMRRARQSDLTDLNRRPAASPIRRA
jgi:hypothetical protein